MIQEWVNVFGISDWITLVINFVFILVIAYRVENSCKPFPLYSFLISVGFGILFFIVPSLFVFISMSLSDGSQNVSCLWMGNFFVFCIMFIIMMCNVP